MKLNVGIIGLGGRAKNHCRALLSNGIEIGAVADPISELCKDFMQEFNIKKSYKDHLELIKDKEINTVAITLGHHLHHKLTIDCCNAGKNVLLEKKQFFFIYF